MWNTTAPESVPKNDPWYLTYSKAPDVQTQFDEILAESGSRIGRLGYAPRDMKEFQNYVGKTVAHYKDRVQYWQCFNEPLLTSYALPSARATRRPTTSSTSRPSPRRRGKRIRSARFSAGFNLGACRNP